MNGAGTACCATEDAHNCKPADSVDANDISFEWEVRWPARAAGAGERRPAAALCGRAAGAR